MRIAVIVPRLLALLALALAPLLALQAQVNAGGLAPGWAINWNGFRLADLASGQVKASLVNKQLQFEVNPEAFRTAQRAYAQEPFATDALFVIGLQQGEEGTELFQAAQELDQRNRRIGSVLLQDAAKRTDLPAMLSLIDRLSRLRPAIAPELVKAFSGSLNDPQSISFIERELRRRPPWAPAFWRAVPAQEPALGNFLDLRRRVGAASDEQSDANLIKALVQAARYAQAFEFRETLSEKSGTAGDNSGAHYAPLDWQLAQGRNVQARFDPSGQMDIFVDRGSAGELARKLVRLSPGLYRLTGSVERRQGSGSITADLTCAASGEEDPWSAQSVGEGVSWEVSRDSCAFAWLVLEGSAWDSQLPLRATVSGLSRRDDEAGTATKPDR